MRLQTAPIGPRAGAFSIGFPRPARQASQNSHIPERALDQEHASEQEVGPRRWSASDLKADIDKEQEMRCTQLPAGAESSDLSKTPAASRGSRSRRDSQAMPRRSSIHKSMRKPCSRRRVPKERSSDKEKTTKRT